MDPLWGERSDENSLQSFFPPSVYFQTIHIKTVFSCLRILSYFVIAQTEANAVLSSDRWMSRRVQHVSEQPWLFFERCSKLNSLKLLCNKQQLKSLFHISATLTSCHERHRNIFASIYSGYIPGPCACQDQFKSECCNKSLSWLSLYAKWY